MEEDQAIINEGMTRPSVRTELLPTEEEKASRQLLNAVLESTDYASLVRGLTSFEGTWKNLTAQDFRESIVAPSNKNTQVIPRALPRELGIRGRYAYYAAVGGRDVKLAPGILEMDGNLLAQARTTDELSFYHRYSSLESLNKPGIKEKVDQAFDSLGAIESNK